MRKTALLLLILVYILTACSSGTSEPANSNPSYPNPSYPNPTYPNPSSQNDYAPQPSDASLVRGNVYLETKELLILESFPLQFTLHLTGNLPTPCHSLRAAVNPPDSENKVVVDAYSMASPDKICAQVLVPFDVTIPLGSFPPGKYTLWVNGEMIAEFQS